MNANKQITLLEAFEAVDLLIEYFKTNIGSSNAVLANQNISNLCNIHTAMFAMQHLTSEHSAPGYNHIKVASNA